MISLEVAGLAVEAGGLTVVRDLDLVLAAGDKVGVVGRNGAGKTSTLRVLAGELPRRPGRCGAGAPSDTSGRIRGNTEPTTARPGSSTSSRPAG